MKTQLLEDIGENTTLPVVPSALAGQSDAGKEVHQPAPAPGAEPARPRSAMGVWRQAPAGTPEVSTTQQPVQESTRQPSPQPAALDLNDVFEEIAALEAQYVAPVPPVPPVPPAQPQPPAMAPSAPQPELQAPPAAPLHVPAAAPAGPTLGPDPTDTATVPQDPLFDFTLPSPELQAGNPFTHPGAGASRSGRRLFLRSAGLLALVLLVLGGGWVYLAYQETGALPFIADAAKDTLQVEKTVQPQPIAEAASTPEPGPVAPITPAEPASRPASSVPPLVYLERDPPPAPKAEQPVSSAADQAPPRTAPAPAPAAEPAPPPPLPKRSSQKARERSEAPAKRAAPKTERAPVRQLARASVVAPDKPSGPDTSMEATLKACREHGYHAAQCIKRGCSVTEYGFVCRGR